MCAFGHRISQSTIESFTSCKRSDCDDPATLWLNNCRTQRQKMSFGGIRWGKRGRAWVDRGVGLETRRVKGLWGQQLCPRKVVSSCSNFHHHSKTRYPHITNLNSTWLWDRDPLLGTAEPEASWLQSCYMYKKRTPHMQIIIQSLD
jgi:hypothetical protein